MNRWKSTLVAGLFASASMSGAVWAQEQTKKAKDQTNKADATQVVPSREDLKSGAAPTARGMDDNAQRQHGRDGATRSSGTPNAKANARAETQAAAGVRDWSQIDKNNDNLVQPEEMEAWLAQVGPQAKPKQ